MSCPHAPGALWGIGFQRLFKLRPESEGLGPNGCWIVEERVPTTPPLIYGTRCAMADARSWIERPASGPELHRPLRPRRLLAKGDVTVNVNQDTACYGMIFPVTWTTTLHLTSLSHLVSEQC